MNYERADVADSFDDPEAAGPILDFLDDVGQLNSNARYVLNLQKAWFYGRRGRYDEAVATIAQLPHDVGGAYLAQASLKAVAAAYVAVASGSTHGADLAREAVRISKQQGATRWRRVADLCFASCAIHSRDFSAAIRSDGVRLALAYHFYRRSRFVEAR